MTCVLYKSKIVNSSKNLSRVMRESESVNAWKRSV